MDRPLKKVAEEALRTAKKSVREALIEERLLGVMEGADVPVMCSECEQLLVDSIRIWVPRESRRNSIVREHLEHPPDPEDMADWDCWESDPPLGELRCENLDCEDPHNLSEILIHSIPMRPLRAT